MRRLLGLLATLAISAVAMTLTILALIEGPTKWSELAGRVQLATIHEGPGARSYRVYRPAETQHRPALVIALHGAGGNGLQMERSSRLDDQAGRLGAIIAYPDGVADGWEPFGCCHHPGVDDVGFISDLIDRLEASDGVDPSRVYVTGISRGGMMAYRLACQLSSRLAAIAPVAGNMADQNGNVDSVACKPDRPVSVLAVHGSADPEVPVEGGRSRIYQEEVAYAPFDGVVRRWRQLDGCGPSPVAKGSGASRTTSWNCSGGAQVVTLLVSGGGHTWPGAIENPPWGPAASVDASPLIADFFGAHRRSPAAGAQT
jgi:polyhydroxybutyrate depolymerase